MKILSTLFWLLMVCGLAGAVPARPRPEIMGISLDMKRDDARARLQSLGTLEKEDRKRQEVWAIKDPRVSHLLVGYDGEYRVRYIVDDEEMQWIDAHEDLVLTGWTPGKHTIRIELVGPDGWPYRNGDYNVVTRELTVLK